MIRAFRVPISAAFLLCASQLEAQCTPNSGSTTSSSISIELCMQAQDVLRLSVSSGSTSLGTPKMANFGKLAANAYLTATPLASAAGPSISVTANRAYEVSIRADDITGPVGVLKPVSDIEWRLGSGSFTPLSTSKVTMISNGAPGVGTAQALAFQSRWAFERDKPGSYSTTIAITLSAK